jgi:hypothetical protein
VNQGIFVVDTTNGVVSRIARTGENFSDFVYWTFSGKPPGVGGSDESDGEVPRWRSSAFSAVSQGLKGEFLVAFKSRTGTLDPVENSYINPVDGIYVGNGNQVDAMLDTNTLGQSLDPAAPVGSKISALGIERESFRGSWFALTATMLEPVSSESLAGIYLTRFPTPPSENGQGNNGNGNGKLSKSAKKKLAGLNTKKKGLFQKIKAANSTLKKNALQQRLQFINQQIIEIRNGL